MNNDLTCLYIHIPFCDHICSYCDFYKKIAKKEVINKYISYLEKELILKKQYLNNIKTIYIGGGTPSCIGIFNLKLLLAILKRYINFNEVNEFSIECNPIDITTELVNLLKNHQVNRISLGVQSTNDNKLKFLNRNHTKKDVINCLKILKNENFNNINIDLMYGLPNDNFSLIKKDLNLIKKFDNIKHVSCYSLILEEKTILFNMYQNNEFKLFNEDKEAKIYYKIQKYLKKLKFNQYEISNFCKEGYECLYNLNTWNNNKYLGIGASASYYIDNKRYTNIKNIDKYFDSLDNNKMAYYEEEIETINSKIYEEIILGLRKTKGINVAEFKRKYNFDLLFKYPSISYLLENDFLKLENNFLYIPSDKLYISNTIINKIVD